MSEFGSLLMGVLIISLLILWYRLGYSQRRNGFMQFVKYRLVPVTVISGWTFYFIAYYFYENEQLLTSGLLAVFSTARFFVLENDLNEIQSFVKGNHLLMLLFSMIGASAVFISAFILLQLFGKRVVTKIKIGMDKSAETHLFFGVNRASLSLAKDLLRNNRSRLVIFVRKMDKNEDVSLYHEVEEAGAFLISRDSVMENIELEKEDSIIHSHKEGSIAIGSNDSKHRYLKELRLIGKLHNRTTHLYFLTPREHWNLSLARTVLEEVNSLPFEYKVAAHIRVTSADLEELFYKSLSVRSPKVKINLVNLSEIASRQLISSYNPVDWIEKNTQKAVASSDLTVLVVGFGQTGGAVLKKLVEYGQFVGSDFNAIMVDKEMKTKKGRFEACFPGLLSNYNIEFVETEPGWISFYDLIKQQANKLDYIILTLGNDDLNIQTATDLQQILVKSTGKRIRIIAQIKDDTNYNLLFNPAKQVVLSIFGREKDIFTEKIIVRGDMEKTAKKIHEYYNSKKEEGPKRQSWHELSVIKQLSNISAANHIYTKLRLSGLTVEDVKQFETIEDFENYLGGERFENLAKEEHLRWNALHFANGWNTWNLSEIPGNAGFNKDEERKLHACLVNWTDLAPVKERFNEDYYAYDFENVSNLFELIKNGVYNESYHTKGQTRPV
jgi:hypothetical protein